MKQMQEYTAEVFRRSEERIQKRKQTQKRILLSAVPMVLCAVIITGGFLPRLQRKNAPSGNSQSEAIIGGTEAPGHDGTGSTSYAQVQIQSLSGSETISEQQAVDTVYAIIQSIILPPPSAGSGESVSPEDNATGDLNATPLYTITFTSETGKQAIYTLSGSILTETASGQVAELNYTQLHTLKAALHLPD